MSGHGCSVDTALPEGFLRERLLETRGELYHHHHHHSSSRSANDQRTSSSAKMIPDSFMHHHIPPNMSPPTFGSLIDLYRTDPVDGLFSTLRISSSTSTMNTSCSSSSSTSYFSSLATASCDSLHDTWSSSRTSPSPSDREESKKRSSSLKSSRTNNGSSSGATNGEKKIVRFADVLGLDLADVHTFLDEIPRIPKSAFKDLKNVDLRPSSPPVSLSRSDTRNLVPLFSQPAAQGWFTERLARNKLCLENAFVTSTGCLNVRGTVRVVNVSFEKKVVVRYTTDKWNSFTEAQCIYIDGSSDGYSDRFGFTIPVSNLQVGQRIELALNYIVCGEEFWDNNSGANYSFQCVPEGPPKPITSAYVPSSSLGLETWGSFY